MLANELYYQKLQSKSTEKQHSLTQTLTQDGQAPQKPQRHFSPISINGFSSVKNQVTFKAEKVFFFIVIFATVGLCKSVFQR
tara:strand:- start:34 stop:279 length:246 start_codon:yes stop_codon:yes gene_type:complete